jgi:phenylacetate-CoA ligase
MQKLSSIFHKFRGTAFIAWQLLGQRQVPYLPIRELEARRDKNVRAIVRYAAETVPFYRRLFQTEGLNPNDFQTADDLAKLPLIDKPQVQAEAEQFRSESPEGREAFLMPTSGTSGVQLQIYQSQDYLLANSAHNERLEAVVRELLGPGTPVRRFSVTYPNNSLHKIRGQLHQHAFLPSRSSQYRVSLFDPLETIIAEINRRRPNVLVAYGTFIELLYKTIRAGHIPMHLPKVVFYVSDHLPEDTQQLIEAEYGAKVLSSYSAVEALRIGFTCPAHTGFHLHADLAHLRIVDEAGRDVPPGTTGDIALSNLSNRGTVLLNYLIGDRGQLATTACTCGRTLPLLAKLEGRRDDVVALPDGRFLHSATVWFAIRDNHDYIQYQLVQHTLERFELKLATVDEPTFTRVSEDLMARLRPVLGEGTVLTATYVNPYEPFGQRKRSQLISYLNV